jgi:hypothetical protein
MVTKSFLLQKGGVLVISYLKKKIIPPMPSWVSKKFQLPSNGGVISDGD